MDAAAKHCAVGAGIWQWANNDAGLEPDLVYACAGDVPTLEVLAATVIGLAVVQDPLDAEVPSMPENVLREVTSRLSSLKC